ncbi:MAG: LLM class flavin-dependent oxidoreductase, partial [Gammaproteobacteria bacterium]|nr:LLM class flavin-dependent oxidoreductase [Gammaproteobacteria bacterium]
DEEKGLIPIKHMLALYIGGMGAKDRNFHKELIGRMGFEAEAEKIQDLYLAGKKDEAAMAVPTALADEISLVGSVDKIKDRLQAWDETPVTSLNVSARSVVELQQLADIVLDR